MRADVVAGTAFKVVLQELVRIEDGPANEMRHVSDGEAPFSDDEPLLQTSEILPARQHMLASQLRAKSPLFDDPANIETRIPPTGAHNGVTMAPKVWLTKGMSWTLTIHPDAPGGGRIVFTGSLTPDVNSRFVVERILKEIGTYELVVSQEDGSVVPLIDWRGSLVEYLRIEVAPGPITRLQATLSCSGEVDNGHLLPVHIVLQGSDAHGNIGEIDPSLCFLEVISNPTGQLASRVPLDSKGGQSQTLMVCVVEQSLVPRAGAWHLAAWAQANNVNLGETISLLGLRVKLTNEANEAQTLGELKNPSFVKVNRPPLNVRIGHADLDAEGLGLTLRHVRSLPDFGAAAFKAAAKLRDEVRTGLVTCTSNGVTEGDQFQKICRYFHVINVYVIGGQEGNQVLMEFARMQKSPVSQSIRVGVISSKFRTATRMGNELDTATYTWAAQEAVFKALNLKKGVRVECDPVSYRTEHVYARSKLMPTLSSIFIVHHVTASVRPMSNCDFFVNLPAYDSFFVWQPLVLVQELIAERRHVLLEDYEARERPPDLGKHPAASWLVIHIRLPGQGKEEAGIHEYLEENTRFLRSTSTPRDAHESIAHRTTTLRNICTSLFPHSARLTLQPVPLGSTASVIRMMATHTGDSSAGASLLLIGPHDELSRRAATFAELSELLEESGEGAEQLIGLGPPVRGDDAFSGACAPIRGGIWEIPEFAHCGLALSVTPLSQSYATMLAGDPKKCVHHVSMAGASLANIAEKIEEANPGVNLENVAELTELVAKSYKVYDTEFDKLYKAHPHSTESLLSVQDEELWEARREDFPLANGKSKLCQPSLGFEDTWRNNENHKTLRYRNLIDQAKETQLAVKNRLLRSPMPLSRLEMQAKWPEFTRLGGTDMLPWGCGEAFDPGTKGEKRLVEKADIKYEGNVALLKDVSRFSIYYPDSETLFAGLEALRKNFVCVKIENRFRSPTVLGWRDVSVVIEETLTDHRWGPDGARHLCEIQLQLNGYTAAREHAHHYYELVRKKIVAESNVRDVAMQEKLLLTLLTAIVGESASVSGSLLKNNHTALADAFGAAFEEIWSTATCRYRHPPDQASMKTWCIAKDVVDEVPQLPLPARPSTRGAHGGRPMRAIIQAEGKKFTRAARLIIQAAKQDLVIREVVDSCLRKLGVASWDRFNGRHIQMMATKLLASEPINRCRAAPGMFSSDCVLLGMGHDNLRLCDLLVDLRGKLWCSVVDGVPDKHCSLSPTLHEIHLTYGTLKLVSAVDLVEAFALTNEVADLDFSDCSSANLSYVEPPSRIKSHSMRQSYSAAALLRRYAWLYAGDRSVETGDVLDVLNLQHAGVLASRYLLSREFLRRSSASVAWAFLGMAVNYDRASGPSEAAEMDVELLTGLSGEQAAHAMQAAQEYRANMAARDFIRPDPVTGERPCDNPSEAQVAQLVAMGGGLDCNGHGVRGRLLAKHENAMSKDHSTIEESDEPELEGVKGVEGTEGEEGKEAEVEENRAVRKDRKLDDAKAEHRQSGVLRLPVSPAADGNALHNYAQLCSAYCERLRMQTTAIKAVYCSGGELGVGISAFEMETSQLMIVIREAGESLLAPGSELSSWIAEEVQRFHAEAKLGVRKMEIIAMCGTRANERGQDFYGETEQTRLNSYLCTRLINLLVMYRLPDGSNLLPVEIKVSDFVKAASKMEEAMVAGRGDDDLLGYIWSERFGPVDRRKGFLKEAQNRGELMIIIQGVHDSDTVLAEHLPNLRGVARTILTHVRGDDGPEPLPGKLAQAARQYDVLHAGLPSFLFPHRSSDIVDELDVCDIESIQFVMMDLTAIRIEIEVHQVLNERHNQCSSFFVRMREKEHRDAQGNLRGGVWEEIHIDAEETQRDGTGFASRKIPFTFDDLLEDTEYEFSVCGVNKLGIGGWSDVQSCRTSKTPRDLGPVGNVELLTERFRPRTEHFQEIGKMSDLSKPKHGAGFDDFNKQYKVPCFVAPPLDESTLPTEMRDGWSHAGRFASACMSSTLADLPGITPFGADNVLKNTGSFVRKSGQLVQEFIGGPVPEDFRPRDGSAASWTSISGTAKGPSRGASGGSKSMASEHLIRHEMGTVHIPPAAAAVVGEESGTTHAQSCTDLNDHSPALFVVFPVGCLLEEIHVFDGFPSMVNNYRSRISQLLIEVYHLDQQQLESRAEFDSLSKVTRSMRPLWSGVASPSGVSAGVVNLKRWAADEKSAYETRTGRPYHKVGGVAFSGGVMGIAQLPNNDVVGGATQATGVVGNVICVKWAPDSDGRAFVNNPPGGDHIRFAIGGIEVVGRRIKEPLWRGSAKFLKAKVVDDIGKRHDGRQPMPGMLMRQVTMAAMDRPDLHRSDLGSFNEG